MRRAEGAVRAHEKKVFQSPDRASVEKEFGKDNVKDDPSVPGGWVCTIKHDKQKMLRAEQMMRGVRKEDAERGKEVQSEYEREDVFYPDGSKRSIVAHTMDAVRQKFKKGLRGAGKYGLAPTQFYCMHGTRRLVHTKGPDTMWFEWDDGWQPRPAEGWPHVSPQRDPDGNVWVEKDDDWVLEGE